MRKLTKGGNAKIDDPDNDSAVALWRQAGWEKRTEKVILSRA